MFHSPRRGEGLLRARTPTTDPYHDCPVRVRGPSTHFFGESNHRRFPLPSLSSGAACGPGHALDPLSGSGAPPGVGSQVVQTIVSAYLKRYHKNCKSENSKLFVNFQVNDSCFASYELMILLQVRLLIL